MSDQPSTRADTEGFAEGIKGAFTNLNASTTQLANVVAALTNQITALSNQIANAGQGGGLRMGPNLIQQGRDNTTVVELARVQQGENNRVVIDENRSSNEESMKEEIGQENLHNNYDSHMDAKKELLKDEIVDQWNKQSNHVKTDILLFYGISEVDETLIIP